MAALFHADLLTLCKFHPGVQSEVLIGFRVCYLSAHAWVQVPSGLELHCRCELLELQALHMKNIQIRLNQAMNAEP